MLSRTSMDRLLNKTDSSSVLKDGKTESVHGLLQHQSFLYVCQRLDTQLRGVAETLTDVRRQ